MRPQDMVRDDRVKVVNGYEALQTHSLKDGDIGRIDVVCPHGSYVVTDEGKVGFVPAVFLEKVNEDAEGTARRST